MFAFVVQVMDGAVIVQVHVLALLVLIKVEAFPEVNPLKENVVAEGDAEVEPDPGNVMIIFPPFGTGVELTKETVCIAVWFETSTSAPATPDETDELKNTVVSAADWEATVKPVNTSAPVAVFIIFAESDAKNLEPLLNIDSCGVAELFEESGDAAEGREVVIVSERDDIVAA